MSGRALREFTRAEVEGRNRKEDALIIIDNVVYDVTEWIEHHPGGPEVLIDNAGRDASQCFHDVGHSEDAIQWRERFKVGEVAAAERREVVKRRGPGPGRAAPRAEFWPTVRAAAPPLALAVLAFLLYPYLLS